jgi:hypothetical protein
MSEKGNPMTEPLTALVRDIERLPGVLASRNRSAIDDHVALLIEDARRLAARQSPSVDALPSWLTAERLAQAMRDSEAVPLGYGLPDTAKRILARLSPAPAGAGTETLDQRAARLQRGRQERRLAGKDPSARGLARPAPEAAPAGEGVEALAESHPSLAVRTAARTLLDTLASVEAPSPAPAGNGADRAALLAHLERLVEEWHSRPQSDHRVLTEFLADALARPAPEAGDLRAALGKLTSIAARMARLEGGCVSGHRSGRWHMHEDEQIALARELNAVRAALSKESGA